MSTQIDYADVKRELNMMSEAMQVGNSDAAKHHEFVALIMANELARERKIHDAIKSKNDRVILSPQACIVQA